MNRLHSWPILALLTCCGVTPPNTDGWIYPATEKVRVTRAPTADFDAADVTTVEVADSAAVNQWRETLDAIPAEPERGVRMIRFLPNTVEYRIEFVGADGAVVGKHRMKGECLAVASHPGWAFYSGEDQAFAALVEALFATD